MFSIITAAALILAPLATTAPTPDNLDTTNTLVPNRICVYICEDVNFEGTCQNVCNGPGLCQTIPSPLGGEVSAIGPAEDASGCSFYTGTKCDGERLADIKDPGIADLTANGWNDRIQSWLCY